MKIFMAIVLFITPAFSHGKDLPSIEKIQVIEYFKTLDGIFTLLQAYHSKEELNYLRNKLIAAGFKPTEPLEIKINKKDKSINVPKLNKTFVFNKNQELSAEGLIFKLDLSISLDKNTENFEKLFEKKGYGKFEVGISKAQAMDAQWTLVGASAAFLAITLALAHLPALTVVALTASLLGFGSYLAIENPGLTVTTAKIKMTPQDLSEELSNLDSLTCEKKNSVSVHFKDKSKISFTLDKQNTVSDIKVISSAGIATSKIYFPQAERQNMGQVFSKYCLDKPSKDSAEFSKIVDSLKAAFRAAVVPIDTSNSTS